jgi:hypothetical protein
LAADGNDKVPFMFCQSGGSPKSNKLGPRDSHENEATLRHAILAAAPTGIGITQMLNN